MPFALLFAPAFPVSFASSLRLKHYHQATRGSHLSSAILSLRLSLQRQLMVLPDAALRHDPAAVMSTVSRFVGIPDANPILTVLRDHARPSSLLRDTATAKKVTTRLSPTQRGADSEAASGIAVQPKDSDGTAPSNLGGVQADAALSTVAGSWAEVTPDLLHDM